MEHDGGGQQGARASMSRTGTEVRARYDYGGKERKESWWQCLCGAAESAVGSSRAVELAAAAQILRGEDDTETEKPRGSNWVSSPDIITARRPVACRKTLRARLRGGWVEKVWGLSIA